jgi:hypothetical protein
MNLLAHVLESSISLPTIEQLDLTQILLRLLTLLPLIGGYLLAREGKGNLLFEVSAVLLLVLATVIPFETTATLTLTGIFGDFIARWPVMVFLLGLAFVRDGGMRIVIGVVLMAVSGLILIPHL